MKLFCLLLNLLGGAGVLGTYAHGILTHKNARTVLWGSIPTWMQPLYSVSMVLATAGYLICSFYLLFAIDPNETRIFKSWGYGVFAWIYLLIIIPSMLWMPLTFKMAASPNDWTWVAIRTLLFVVALAGIFWVVAMFGLTPRGANTFYWAAVVGSLAFCIHVAVLDAIVWPYFR